MWREEFLYPAIPEKIGKVTVTGHAGDFFLYSAIFFLRMPKKVPRKMPTRGEKVGATKR